MKRKIVFMKIFYFLTNLCILSIWTTISGFSQYEISLTMKTQNDTVYLMHYFAKENLYYDTVAIMKNGKSIFKGNKVLPKGLYSIVVNKIRQFDLLIGDNQKFGIEADTTDFINNNRFISSPDNDAYYVHLRDDIQRGKKQQQLREQYQNAADDAEKRAIAEQLQALYSEKMALTQKLISNNEGLYVSKFLKSLIPFEMPEPPRDEQGRITDSTFQYRWIRTRFFDGLDIYDPDMLRTSHYEKRITDYLNWFIRSQHPLDTICAEFDRMLTKAKPNKEVFRCVLATIYNFAVKIDLIIRDNLWVHLVDNWYVPYADWGNVEDMKKTADKIRPTLIGQVAPPMEQLLWLPPDHFRAAALDTAIKNDIHAGRIIPDFRQNIQSKYLVLLFWDVTCGHCKTTIQELWEVFEACKDKGLQVISVQTLIGREGKVKWIDYINENGMYDWFNAWIIYDLKWHDLYIHGEGVPKIYLLNEKKEIMLRGLFDIKNIQVIVEADAKN